MHLNVATCAFKTRAEAAYRRPGCASGNSAHAVSDSECTGSSFATTAESSPGHFLLLSLLLFTLDCHSLFPLYIMSAMNHLKPWKVWEPTCES